jgi:predicted O-methyltransferase YrrM
MSDKIDQQLTETPGRSRVWREKSAPRYWWYRLPDTDYIPSLYSDLSEEEWMILREWHEVTDNTEMIGESSVPLISLLHGLIDGNRIDRIVQLGTCSGYCALLLGFILRRTGAMHGLFTLDTDPKACAFARQWLTRAQLGDHVNVAELSSLDPGAVGEARDYLQGDPKLIIIDSSHEYAATLRELDAWFPALAPTGLIVLHDVSRFAAEFDVTHRGGVQRAFTEWRKLHPNVEAILLNGDSRTMALDTVYKDACGLGLIHKSAG